MKKALCLLLAVCFAFLLTAPALCADSDISDVSGISVEFSSVTDGVITVSVFSDTVKNLTAASFELLFDSSVYGLVSADEGVYYEDGEEFSNFFGVWQFGKKSDGSGAAAVFISSADNGVSKAEPAEMCRFTLCIKDGYSENTGICFFIKELCTNDGNINNDIYSRTLAGQKKYTFTDADRFSFEELGGGKIRILKYNFFEKSVCIPEKINGQTAAEIGANAFSGDGAVFIFVPQSVTAIAGGAFKNPESRVIFTCENSAAADFAERTGIASAIALKQSEFLFDGRLLRTEKLLCTEPCFFTLAGGVECEIMPSHSTKIADFFGTGSVVSFAYGGETLSLSLAVIGDLNGDSVPDALDLSLAELCCSCHIEPDGALLAALDINGSGDADGADYSALVNSALAFDGSFLFDK